ncbi:hypothetical protein ACIPIN_11315, partial [Pseudomonas sp. NPDC087697]
MGELAKEILPVNIEDELKQSYLDYDIDREDFFGQFAHEK